MQAHYPDGLKEAFGSVEEFDVKAMKKHLEAGASKVTVFNKGSAAHKKAETNYSRMTKNQKKRFRKKHRNL